MLDMQYRGQSQGQRDVFSRRRPRDFRRQAAHARFGTHLCLANGADTADERDRNLGAPPSPHSISNPSIPVQGRDTSA